MQQPLPGSHTFVGSGELPLPGGLACQSRKIPAWPRRCKLGIHNIAGVVSLNLNPYANGSLYRIARALTFLITPGISEALSGAGEGLGVWATAFGSSRTGTEFVSFLLSTGLAGAGCELAAGSCASLSCVVAGCTVVRIGLLFSGSDALGFRRSRTMANRAKIPRTAATAFGDRRRDKAAALATETGMVETGTETGLGPESFLCAEEAV